VGHKGKTPEAVVVDPTGLITQVPACHLRQFVKGQICISQMTPKELEETISKAKEMFQKVTELKKTKYTEVHCQVRSSSEADRMIIYLGSRQNPCS
jgi:rRNA-processing protein FCF1